MLNPVQALPRGVASPNRRPGRGRRRRLGRWADLAAVAAGLLLIYAQQEPEPEFVGHSVYNQVIIRVEFRRIDELARSSIDWSRRGC